MSTIWELRRLLLLLPDQAIRKVPEFRDDLTAYKEDLTKRFVRITAIVAFVALPLDANSQINMTGGVNPWVTIPMKAQNGSGQNGTARLMQSGKDVLVVISIAKGTTTPQPAHVHPGTCAKLNPAPKYPLSNVVNGKSKTTLKNLKLSSLQTGGFAINVHKSTTQIAVYTSCGDIPKAPMHKM